MMKGNTALNTPLVERKALFWDIDPARIGTALIENDDWAIVRIFEYGTISDIHHAIEFYGPEKTATVLSHEKLRPTARVMAYLFLQVDPEHRYLA